MESTLTMTRSQLKAEIGFFLGWGRGVDFGNPDWDTDQSNAITSCVNSGLRRFYRPPQANGGFYEWTFLRPLIALTLATNVAILPMPDDFGGIEGPITVTLDATSTAAPFWPVYTTHEGSVRQLYSAVPAVTGRPTHAAIRPQRTITGDTGQRFEMYLYPLPDQAYSIQFQYVILPNALSDAIPIPYGAGVHSETILESCLAVAEERLDNEQTVHRQAFATMLAASMAQDRRMKPQTLGYNGDNSDWRNWSGRTRGFNFPAITYNGTQYQG